MTQFNNQFFPVPDLAAAIDRNPVIATLETPLQDAIALMSQRVVNSCLLTVEEPSLDLFPYSRVSSSCVLILQEQKILGILTERDIVRLTAAEIDFSTVKVAEVMTENVVILREENFQDIFAALFLFRRYRIRHLPVVDAHNNLIGLISTDTIRQVIRPANLLKLRRVADVMNKNVVQAFLSTSVLNLARLMNKYQVSCVVITQEDPERDFLIPVGIITERDMIQFQSLQLNLGNLQASEVMSTPLFLLHPEDSLLTAHQEMQRRKVRRLVVSWNWGQGLGLVTQTSLLRVFDPMEMYGVIETLQRTIQELEAERNQLLTMLQNKSS